MNLSDLILTLIRIVVAGLGWLLIRLSDEMSKLNDKINNCQVDMPQKFVLKDDYKDDIDDLKRLIVEQGNKTDRLLERVFERLETKADK